MYFAQPSFCIFEWCVQCSIKVSKVRSSSEYLCYSIGQMIQYFLFLMYLSPKYSRVTHTQGILRCRTVQNYTCLYVLINKRHVVLFFFANPGRERPQQPVNIIRHKCANFSSMIKMKSVFNEGKQCNSLLFPSFF